MTMPLTTYRAMLGALMGAAACMAPAYATPVPEARADAARYVLEKLQRQQGDVWDGGARLFRWEQRFAADRCRLQVTRADGDGLGFLRLEFPLAEVRPSAELASGLRLGCTQRGGCITAESGQGPARLLSEAPLVIMNSGDIPKISAALEELHRLCDHPYGG